MCMILTVHHASLILWDVHVTVKCCHSSNLPGCLGTIPSSSSLAFHSPSHLLDHSTAGLSWNNDFLVQILWGISFQTWLLWVYVALPGNESIFPKNQPGTFWDGEILVPFGVIRDRLLEKPIFGEKAGRESWRNHSRILRHFAMKSIMLQELNENSLATRILDSSLWSPATQITESPMFVNEKKPC